MGQVIHAWHAGAKLPENEGVLRGLYQSVLHDKRALLLVDNAESAAQIESLIPPTSRALLITSRLRFTLPGLFPFNLESLPAGDACALLVGITPRLADHAEVLAELCGYLPLALRLAPKQAHLEPSPADWHLF